MAAAYLKELQDLLGRLGLETNTMIECKHFFSGAAAYAQGHIFMTLTPVGLALKLPEELRKTLLEKGATPLKYFPKAPIKKDYVVLPPKLLKNKTELACWIHESLGFCLSN